jgi:hypothetical protein
MRKELKKRLLLGVLLRSSLRPLRKTFTQYPHGSPSPFFRGLATFAL